MAKLIKFDKRIVISVIIACCYGVFFFVFGNGKILLRHAEEEVEYDELYRNSTLWYNEISELDSLVFTSENGEKLTGYINFVNTYDQSKRKFVFYTSYKIYAETILRFKSDSSNFRVCLLLGGYLTDTLRLSTKIVPIRSLIGKNPRINTPITADSIVVFRGHRLSNCVEVDSTMFTYVNNRQKHPTDCPVHSLIYSIKYGLIGIRLVNGKIYYRRIDEIS